MPRNTYVKTQTSSPHVSKVTLHIYRRWTKRRKSVSRLTSVPGDKPKDLLAGKICCSQAG
jgi:hypothetical protein